MVKTNIDVKVHFKAKNIEVEEYELVMNTWRACMLFFERELRKLNDKGSLTTETLHKISKNLDFTELLRLTFLSLKDNERMRLVKLDEVAEAIQRIQTLSKSDINQTISQSKQLPRSGSYQSEPQRIAESSIPIQLQSPQETTPMVQEQTSLVSNFNDPSYDSLDQLNRPEINLDKHKSVLQRNTASAVIELRKMMYENLQKIRNTLGQESK